MFEWQRRVHCGIRGGRRYDVVSVMPRGRWRQLAVRKGTRLCFAGFELFSAVGTAGCDPRVRSGEVAVYFQVGGECLIPCLRSEGRGILVSRGEGFLMSLAPWHVWGIWDRGCKCWYSWRRDGTYLRDVDRPLGERALAEQRRRRCCTGGG
jgi:hypothetical protein